ncbi:glycoside hydrolase/phage tail family protein [Cognatishimia sp. SS12]|uniref:baseplate multidomain protein megatron n=1 Tax=Cognatishimia sp. SS12 TaxID=2979465 RepID=UPI00232D0118|nr:glycoside hydrolase/phage tail family protein [Cognatishimia sp. SS12]MDC0737523.1 glycoside hydrolase/phage tail family protein [Cognatishimia sp. SS12]
MATMVLSAAGAAIGGAVGGTVLGVSSVAVGRLVGAMAGQAIDQRIAGQGAEAVETGRIDRYRLTGDAEGAVVPRIYGRMRVGGQVIWATEFQEHVSQSGGGGGKGAPARPQVTDYSYSVSLALAICEGEITGVTRLWADGREIAPDTVNMRVYPGSADQQPDPKMEAVEGPGAVPAYRGTAYVVLEDLDLAPYGNRVPQFTFEVSRPSPRSQAGAETEPTHATQAVALIPGSGEYALATSPVYYDHGPGAQVAANLNAPSGESDFATAMAALGSELPNCQATSLIVSWFGDDLRCGNCSIQPRVESDAVDGTQPWQVAGVPRAAAALVPQQDGRPVYGGTPNDAAVIEAIQHLNALGKAVMYYPFVLMTQMAGNGLPDPWSGAADQPQLPWRGRITLSVAPGQAGSPDGSVAAEAEVAAFFGTAAAMDFAVENGTVVYSGPAEWSYRRFILHQAALCVAAGGVDSFCIGSELRGLTWARGGAGQFVAVAALQALASEVRQILGPNVKLGYAADWSEYFGYQPQDGSHDRYFHLDPLWADAEIDFVGIDNYMPLSDWRDGTEHADAEAGSLYDLDYLQSNIEGGEGYDWYYTTPEARDAQRRTPISDGAHGEDWIYRYKDIRNWWANPHHERINGVRQSEPTAWLPEGKPIWFTEIGCGAVDKATNEPNKFLDPKSDESSLPRYSNGLRDELIQTQYLRALYGYWGQADNNPTSAEYAAPMIDMSRAFVWAWDTRPFPRFPVETDLWSDGINYDWGHWISGRSTHRTLASVVREICEAAGVTRYDVSQLWGMVRGYVVDEVVSARQALQPLMLKHGFDAVERDGILRFVMRGGAARATLDPDRLALSEDGTTGPEHIHNAEAELLGRVRVTAVAALGDYDVIAEEAALPRDPARHVSQSQLPMMLLRGEARQVAERWLAESRLAQDQLHFDLPPSQSALGAGDVVALANASGTPQTYRIDRVTQGTQLTCEAVRVEATLYQPGNFTRDGATLTPYVAPAPVVPLFMDLPLLSGEEVPHSPHLALGARVWPGAVAVYRGQSGADFNLNSVIRQRGTVGRLTAPLAAAGSGAIDHGPALEVQLLSGSLQSISQQALLSGGNLAAIGDGTPDRWELIQFQTAELIGPMQYALRQRLRGQAGTDGLEFGAWPAGSWFVLLDGQIDQIDMPESLRGQSRDYRIGPAHRPMDDAAYVATTEAFAGNGLRPYAPVHLRASQAGSGDISFTWLRRTRRDGDRWDLPDVPLSEEREAYRLTLMQSGAVLRSFDVTAPHWQYTTAAQLADGASGLLELQVAQISARYGPGPATRLALTL